MRASPDCDRSWARKLEYATRVLNELLEQVRETHPHAVLYLDGTHNLNLMSGAPHGNEDGSGDTQPHQERILASAILRSSGGDW